MRSERTDRRQRRQEQTSEPELIEAKIVLIGDMAVGKSSLAGRFNHGDFKDIYQNTIGGAYFQKMMSVPDPSNQTLPDGSPKMCQIKLHIWDTGGQEQFRSMLSMYYRDAIAAIICYDCTNELSFKSVDYWTNEMKQKNNMSNFIISLSANKCDMPKD